MKRFSVKFVKGGRVQSDVIHADSIDQAKALAIADHKITENDLVEVGQLPSDPRDREVRIK